MSNLTWRKLYNCYEQGSIVGNEFEWRVFTLLDETNIQDFMDNAPPECMRMMLEGLERYPTTDEDWGRLLIWGIGWRQEDTKPALERTRKGVEAMRKHLNCTKEGWDQ